MIKNVILDTEIFVLFAVGMIDRNYIGKFIKTKQYSTKEFDLLIQKISTFENIFITPHILAEFSHLTIEHKNFRDDYKKALKEFILKLENCNLREINIGLPLIFSNKNIYFLGVADVSIIEACGNDFAIITADGVCADKLRESGKNVLKFIATKGFVDY